MPALLLVRVRVRVGGTPIVHLVVKVAVSHGQGEGTAAWRGHGLITLIALYSLHT